MNPLDSVRQAVEQRYNNPPEAYECDCDVCDDVECECLCHNVQDPDQARDEWLDR